VVVDLSRADVFCYSDKNKRKLVRNRSKRLLTDEKSKASKGHLGQIYHPKKQNPYI